MADNWPHDSTRRDKAELLAGLDPVPPGLVPITEWRPEPADPRFEHAVPVYGAVARKPERGAAAGAR